MCTLYEVLYSALCVQYKKARELSLAGRRATMGYVFIGRLVAPLPAPNCLHTRIP